MDRRRFLLTSSAAFSALVPADGAGKGSTLVVKVNYTGTGAVDEAHKIVVALWDSPNFLRDGANPARPLASKSVSAKSATATFDNVQKSPVYVSLAYDPSGKWDAMSPPPTGASLGLYSKTPGLPEAIALEPGKTATILAPFDDTYKKLDTAKH